MSGEPVRWGVLSTANINRKVLPGLHASDEVELVAVASRDGERAAAYAREHGIPRAHGSYEALLADPEIVARRARHASRLAITSASASAPCVK